MKPSKDVLKDIMSIPSCSGHEGMLRDYILDFANGRGISSTVDRRGNVYLSKGTLAPGELYPCLVNHLDTVHSDQAALAESGKRLEILESASEDGKTVLRADGTGIGADDKLGCALALAILDDRTACRAAFFVEEERGMLGSKEMDVEWFREVSFVLSFDSPGRNRSSRSCSGRKLFTEAFFERYLRDVCLANGVQRRTVHGYRADPRQDGSHVLQRRQRGLLRALPGRVPGCRGRPGGLQARH